MTEIESKNVSFKKDKQAHKPHKEIVNLTSKTSYFGNGARAHGIGKISGVSTKIGNIYSLHIYKFPLLDWFQKVYLYTLFLDI